MTQHKAMPKQWAQCEESAARWSDATAFHCLLELRDRLASAEQRIQALEEPRPDHFPDARKMVPASAGGLVERVAECIGSGDDGHHWSDEARAAILAVAAWLEAHDVAVGRVSSRWLRQEVER